MSPRAVGWSNPYSLPRVVVAHSGSVIQQPINTADGRAQALGGPKGNVPKIKRGILSPLLELTDLWIKIL